MLLHTTYRYYINYKKCSYHIDRVIYVIGDLCPACVKELTLFLKINLIGYLRIKVITSNIETYVQTTTLR